jgi:hypothetical protein
VIYAYYKGVQAIKQGRRKEGNRGDLCQPKDPAPHHRKAGRNVLLDQLLQPERRSCSPSKRAATSSHRPMGFQTLRLNLHLGCHDLQEPMPLVVQAAEESPMQRHPKLRRGVPAK